MFSRFNSNLTICINETKVRIIETFLTDFNIYCKPKPKYIDIFNENNIEGDFEEYIRKNLIKGNFDESIKQLINNEKEDLIFRSNNIIYEITTTNNYNESRNISIIKLRECENKLKQYYNISKNEPLIIFKKDIYHEGHLTPKLGYEIYDMKNKNKLELDICENEKIEILLPCIIDKDNEFKYNTSSEYYNDICYPYTTESGTDIILSDRRNEYIDNNMSLCENNCEYGGYNSSTKKAICKCEVKTETSENEINKILNNFININDITNLKVMKCYRQLFTLDGLLTNIGNYIILSIITNNIFLITAFIIKGFKLIDNEINNLIQKKKTNLIKGNKSDESLIHHNINIIKEVEEIKNKISIKDIKNQIKNNTKKKKKIKVKKNT